MVLFNIFRKKKPNIIMLMIDGARYDAIDKVQYYKELKKESVFFPKLITYAPYTIASLNAIFSGMYGYLNGVNGYYQSYNFDKKNCFTLTQYLKEAGYYTELDAFLDDTIPAQGFDKIRIFGSIEGYEDTFVKRHSEILQQTKIKEPFFLFLDYEKVHQKHVKNVIKKYSDFDEEYFNNKDKNFLQYVEYVSESGDYLKSILDKIKELGLYDDSIIIIFSDHGCSVGDKIGEKVYGSYLYDYTTKCFLYLMGKDIPKGLEIKNLIRSIDIFPTILDMLKLKQNGSYKKIQGKSFLPFLKGKTEERIAYSETGGLGGLTPSPEKHNVKSVRTNKWKLIYNETSNKKELYNLEEDKEEESNLIGKEQEVEGRLWEELQKYNSA